jgi:hypothetical protein
MMAELDGPDEKLMVSLHTTIERRRPAHKHPLERR